MSSLTPDSPRDSDESKHHYEEVKQFDDYPSLDYQLEPSKSPSFGRPRRIGLAPLSSLLAVLFWSFGMGSVLMGWLLIRRVHPDHGPGAIPNHCSGYLIVNEGNKTGSMKLMDGQDAMESKMRGVVIITAISHFSSMAVAPLMALGAYYVAAQWLDEQAQKRNGPTPQQLLLLIQMCSEGSWQSVYATLRYLFGRYRTNSPAARAEVSPLIYRAMFIASIIVTLHYGVVATDLWLSAELGSGYYSVEERLDPKNFPTAPNLGTQNNPNIKTRGMDMRVSPRLDADAEMWQIFDHGDLIMTDRSSQNYIAVVNTSTSPSFEDISHMAVIVRPPYTVPLYWSWTAPSIGLRTNCQPSPCISNAYTGYEVHCPNPPNVTYSPIPYPSFDYASFLADDEFGIQRYAITGDIAPDLLPANISQSQRANPLYYVMKFETQNDAWSYTSSLKEIGWLRYAQSNECKSGTTPGFYFGACEVTLYDVEVNFDAFRTTGSGQGDLGFDTQYRLTPSKSVPMSQERATQVLAPFLPLAYELLRVGVMQSVGVSVAKEVIYPGFSKNVSAEFSRELLAYMSAFNFTTVPAEKVTLGSAKLFSRYPLVQTFAYIGVVYAHGVLAIILFIGVIGKTSRTIVVGDTAWRRNWYGDIVQVEPKPVQELLLVQSRLTDPLAVVAEHFLESDLEKPEKSHPVTSTGTLSAQTDAIDMVEMERTDTARVEIGLIDHQEGERWYGLRHRRNDILVTSAVTGP
ncbi:hypothetical protein FRC02_007024 [Tulasnella sp. 418]|nr:hypothetical protein FRC02_007024 [Tulasnella sp. 418]